VAIAQDDNNKILPIAFAIVESESVGALLFFLQNYKRHVAPQYCLCLISDVYQLIKSSYLRLHSGWMT